MSFLVTVSATEEVVHLFSDLLQPDYEGEMEPGRGKGKMNSATRVSGSGLRHVPFGTSGSGTILIVQLAHRWAT